MSQGVIQISDTLKYNTIAGLYTPFNKNPRKLLHFRLMASINNSCKKPKNSAY